MASKFDQRNFLGNFHQNPTTPNAFCKSSFETMCSRFGAMFAGLGQLLGSFEVILAAAGDHTRNGKKEREITRKWR